MKRIIRLLSRPTAQLCISLVFTLLLPMRSTAATATTISADIHFLHWWTSKGETKAAESVKTTLSESDIALANVPIEGGGGATAKAILQARAIAGNPPEMALIEGPAIKSWAALGFLHQLNRAAENGGWHEKLLPLVKDIHQFEGQFAAIPVTIHRLNWLWVNTDVLHRHGIVMPETWPAIISAFHTLKSRGVTPLAIGNEPWQIVQLFENIAFGLGGSAYYRQAFIELDPKAIDSDVTRQALALFREISDIVADDLSNQSWDVATQDLMAGRRAFQITGDWVAGELMALNGQLPSGISCYPVPSKEPGFIYNMDSFALFHTQQLDSLDANKLAELIASPDFLQRFNQVKGGIPAWQGIELNGFNHCAKQSMTDFQYAASTHALIPSMIDSMAVSPVIQKAVSSELYRFFNHASVTSESVIAHMKNLGASQINL